MNRVPGHASTSAACASSSRSNVGCTARSPNHQSGCCSSSSRRSLRASSGSKNAIGSAVWISTGSPSSPAWRSTSITRGSSGSTSSPEASRTVRPRFFHTFTPRAPAGGAVVERGDQRRRGGRRAAPSRAGRTSGTGRGTRASYRSTFAVTSSPHMPSRFTIVVDAARVHGRDERGDVVDHPVAVGHRPRSASGPGGCGCRWPAPRCGSTSVDAARSCETGCQSREGQVLAVRPVHALILPRAWPTEIA